MPTRDTNRPLAWSHLAGREVSTWSEEWRHECEVAHLASLTLAQRNLMLDGVPGSTDREERGIKGVRGPTAVAELRAAIDRYAELLKRN